MKVPYLFAFLCISSKLECILRRTLAKAQPVSVRFFQVSLYVYVVNCCRFVDVEIPQENTEPYNTNKEVCNIS